MEKLNLGCGLDIKKGYINLDEFKFEGVDVVWNINKTPWPFKKNTFSEIIISHVLEYVENPVKTMEEVWRVAKDNATIRIGVPYFSGLNAITDPTHKNFFAASTFDFFDKTKIKNNYFSNSKMMDFRIVKKEIVFSKNKLLRIFNPLFNINQKVYERFFPYILPAQLINVDLKVVK